MIIVEFDHVLIENNLYLLTFNPFNIEFNIEAVKVKDYGWFFCHKERCRWLNLNKTIIIGASLNAYSRAAVVAARSLHMCVRMVQCAVQCTVDKINRPCLLSAGRLIRYLIPSSDSLFSGNRRRCFCQIIRVGTQLAERAISRNVNTRD